MHARGCTHLLLLNGPVGGGEGFIAHMSCLQAIAQRRQAVEEQLELLTEVDTWHEQLRDLQDFLVLRAVRFGAAVACEITVTRDAAGAGGEEQFGKG